MVGDGLTKIRAKQFSDLIDETLSSYGPQHRVTVMPQQALDQVIFIPGDLHGGGFHVMQVVYNLFYGAIIQKVQAVLKWKCICGSDVSNAISNQRLLPVSLQQNWNGCSLLKTSELFTKIPKRGGSSTP